MRQGSLLTFYNSTSQPSGKSETTDPRARWAATQHLRRNGQSIDVRNGSCNIFPFCAIIITCLNHYVSLGTPTRASLHITGMTLIN